MTLPGSGRRRVTGADVARMAGVSRATVSYVLSGVDKQSIPEPTRLRVMAAARTLRYQPSPVARALRAGRSNVVLGLVDPSDHLCAATSDVFARFSRALAERGLVLVVHPCVPDTLPLEELWKVLTPDCVLSLAELGDEDISIMQAAGVELAVCVNAQPWQPVVGDVSIGQVQVDHLLTRGHRSVAVAVGAHPEADDAGQGRVVVIDEEMGRRGYPTPTALRLARHSSDDAAILAGWMHDNPDATGIAAWDDEIAGRVLLAARALRVPVPDRLAVVGAASSRGPSTSGLPVTSVQVDLGAQVTHVVDRMVDALAGRPVIVGTLDPGSLVVVHGGTT